MTVPPQPGFVPPEPYPSEPPFEQVWYGTAELWTILDPNGAVWRDLPVGKDGSVGDKTLWFSERFSTAEDEDFTGNADITVTAERLDGPARKVVAWKRRSAVLQPRHQELHARGPRAPEAGLLESHRRLPRGRARVRPSGEGMKIDAADRRVDGLAQLGAPGPIAVGVDRHLHDLEAAGRRGRVERRHELPTTARPAYVRHRLPSRAARGPRRAASRTGARARRPAACAVPVPRRSARRRCRSRRPRGRCRATRSTAAPRRRRGTTGRRAARTSGRCRTRPRRSAVDSRPSMPLAPRLPSTRSASRGAMNASRSRTGIELPTKSVPPSGIAAARSRATRISEGSSQPSNRRSIVERAAVSACFHAASQGVTAPEVFGFAGCAEAATIAGGNRILMASGRSGTGSRCPSSTTTILGTSPINVSAARDVGAPPSSTTRARHVFDQPPVARQQCVAGRHRPRRPRSAAVRRPPESGSANNGDCRIDASPNDVVADIGHRSSEQQRVALDRSEELGVLDSVRRTARGVGRPSSRPSAAPRPRA